MIMSLAEPRKRRKNPMHSINLSEPNHWTNDDSKFGQKMLEKFGWTKGSGLGKNQQGISENIRVQQKVTSTGLGFIAHNADDWFKAGEDYSRLLSQLSEKFDQPTIPSKADDDINAKKSLVQNSLNSKSRVHYHKFTKGKDLTQYKKQELECILGKGIKDEDKSANSLNMKEYFKSKRESKTTSHDILGNIDSQIIIDDENNGRVAIKTTDMELKTDLHEINVIPPKKRKCEPNLIKEINIIPSNEHDVAEEQKRNKLIKNVKHDTLCNTDSLIENSETVFAITNEELKTHENETNIVSPKKRKREPILSEESNIPSNESINVEEQKKKRKKSKILTTEDVQDEEVSMNNKCETLITKDNDLGDLNDYKSEYNNEMIIKEQYSELVLAQMLIDNSSAGKKYYKDSDIEKNHFFEKKMEEFVDKVKRKTTTTLISTETKPSDIESISAKSKTLDPSDANFVKDFEAKKLDVLNSLSKRQETNKHMNKMSKFIAKHGNVLFFGSNINKIKGYGE